MQKACRCWRGTRCSFVCKDEQRTFWGNLWYIVTLNWIKEFFNCEQRAVKVGTDAEKLKTVLSTIEEHNEFGLQQLHAYEEYLANVRKSSSVTTQWASFLITHNAWRAKSKTKQHITGPIKFSHNQLLKDGVIMESEVPEDRFVFISPYES